MNLIFCLKGILTELSLLYNPQSSALFRTFNTDERESSDNVLGVR